MKAQLPLFKAELALLPNLKIIMLMGDVAVKMVNMIAKADTGKNLLIEPFKRDTIAEDIRKMMKIIG
jgi:uracil-DNA glycosylase